MNLAYATKSRTNTAAPDSFGLRKRLATAKARTRGGP